MDEELNANTFNELFRVVTFGESHGKALGVVLQDVKPGVDFSVEEIEKELARRRPGRGEYSSTRRESDQIEVLSGVFEGKTTGMPICMIIRNNDAKPGDYEKIKDIFRPGHANYSFYKKYGIFDYRGSGRASGRETVSRVAAGAVAKSILKKHGIKITAYTSATGGIECKYPDLDFVEQNELRTGSRESYSAMKELLEQLKTEGDSVGAVVTCIIKGVKAGLGDPVFEKLDANLAKAMLSIGSVKGIEFGKGFELSLMKGSLANDQMNEHGFLSNNCGGIIGGISNGEDIVFRLAIKPVPSINKPQKTVAINGRPVEYQTGGRHDVCIAPRIVPVVEAMAALVLVDALQYQKLIKGEDANLVELRESIDKIDEDIIKLLARREKVVQSIFNIKDGDNQEIFQPRREKEIEENVSILAEELGLNRGYVRKMWDLILSQSKIQQKNIKKAKKD